MVNLEYVLKLLPEDLERELRDFDDLSKMQEIRIKANKQAMFEIDNREHISKFITKESDLNTILQRVSNYSVYAFEEEIKQGYITIKGGHRVGLCGNCVMEKKLIKTMKHIGSINIRVCREVLGCSDKIIPSIIKNNRVLNTIIISAPKCGKTTLIRDISRNISNGIVTLSFKGKKVCIVDERSEIGACYKGIPEMNVGIRTDVLDSCFKGQGIMMAIRSMSPEVIVCDEIGTKDDMDSIVMALNSGVSLITTIHGYGVEDLYKREVFKKLIDNNVFERAIVLSNKKGVGTIDYIYDFNTQKSLEEN